MTEPIRIVALIFPGMTQLDFTGPAQVFSRIPGAELYVVWRTLDPVPTDAGFAVVPTTTLDDAPQADVLFVPGGDGAFALFEDAGALDFIARQSAGARWTTSVCTGAFALAAAGLLAGRRATTHWASHELLAGFGAIPVRERVVRDGDLITGAGITSGIDFALAVAAELVGAETARRIQLMLEYDPQPPFDAGSPARPEADPGFVKARLADARRARGPLVARAAERLAARRDEIG